MLARERPAHKERQRPAFRLELWIWQWAQWFVGDQPTAKKLDHSGVSSSHCSGGFAALADAIASVIARLRAGSFSRTPTLTNASTLQYVSSFFYAGLV